MASHDKYIPNYSFQVYIGPLTFGFSKVNNISASIEYDTIVDGGSNDKPIIMPKPKRTPDTIVFEKGLKSDMGDMLFSALTAGKKVYGVTIFVKNNGKIQRVFFITEGVIISRQFSPLDALGNQVFLESLTIAHTGLTEIALPLGIPMPTLSLPF